MCVRARVCRELSRKHVDEGKGRSMQSRKVGDTQGVLQRCDGWLL